MVTRLLLFLSLLVTGMSIAQEEYIRPGTLAASATIAPSKMLNHNQSNFYFTGFAEYFLDKKWSFRSDTYLFSNSQSETAILRDGSRSYFGIARHFSKGNWDSYVGYQPGFSLMNRTLSTYQSKLNPSAALRIGTSFYVWKYFHFFANLTYVRSKLQGYPNGAIQTDELIFAAGLGFQLQTRKKA